VPRRPWRSAAAAFTWLQVRATVRANRIPVLLGVLTEHRELIAARRYVNRQLADEHDPSVGVRELPEPAVGQVEGLIRHLDHLGFALASGPLTVEQVEGYVGGSVCRSWEKLWPYAEAERRKNDGGQSYARFFQALAEELA